MYVFVPVIQKLIIKTILLKRNIGRYNVSVDIDKKNYCNTIFIHGL